MKKKLKGGLEGIIALVILAGLVIILIIGIILPMARKTVDTGQVSTDRISGLADKISGEKTGGG